MKRFIIMLAICVAAPLALFAQRAAPEIPYDSVPNLLEIPPNMNLGEIAGVAVNSKGHIFVFSRSNTTGPAFSAAAAQLLEFGPDGEYIREIGHNLYAFSFGHSVRVDKSDNIWVVDKGSDMVIKFNPEGQVTLVFGRKEEANGTAVGPKRLSPPLPAVDGYFRGVTDTAWDAAGNTFISDGYYNSRVAKVDKDGKWLKSFGTYGDGPGQLNTPHSIATDDQGNVYVANRENHRIEVFDNDGKYLRQIKFNVPFDYASAVAPIGNKPPENANGDSNISHVSDRNGGVLASLTAYAPWSVCITPGPNQVLYTSDAFPGRIYKISLDGKVLGVLGHSGKQLKEFGWIHEIACPSENELYVAELLNWRVQKLILHPKK